MEILVKDKTVIIDDVDFELINSYGKWVLSNYGYAVHNYYRRGNKFSEKLYMHRLIMNADVGQFIDHINGNKLDNRRSNLRFCTKSQNSTNKKPTSGRILPKGVDSFGLKYRARIMDKGKNIHLGMFDTIFEAHAAYCAASKKYHGEFGRTE